MFFPERITLVKKTDRVLEVGPGSTPHPRSDVLLERKYDNEAEFRLQRGNTDALQTNKKVVLYEGGNFPFANKEFDYVICSHVLEHVEDPPSFLKEVFRVGKKGYIEFPTSYYDFVYNIPVHKVLLMHKKGKIFWLPKSETAFEAVKPFQDFLFATLMKEHFGMVNSLREYFVQGFEWEEVVAIEKAKAIEDLCLDNSQIQSIPFCRPEPVSLGLKAEIRKKLKGLFSD
jgi:SAM-dependent methyltransferase